MECHFCNSMLDLDIFLLQVQYVVDFSENADHLKSAFVTTGLEYQANIGFLGSRIENPGSW